MPVFGAGLVFVDSGRRVMRTCSFLRMAKGAAPVVVYFPRGRRPDWLWSTSADAFAGSGLRTDQLSVGALGHVR